jgi:hypothetical protein
MNLDHLASAAINYLFGRLLRRVVAVIVAAIFVVVAVYQGSVAGTIWLALHYGEIHAHVIMCAIYAGLALIALAIFWAIGRNSTNPAPAALAPPREMQLAMLVEAVMLGYSLAQKSDRVS